MRRFAISICVVVFAFGVATDPTEAQQRQLHRVFAENEVCEDIRFETTRNLRDKFHPWTPPATADEWKAESQRIRHQLLVSNGLWPLPVRTP